MKKLSIRVIALLLVLALMIPNVTAFAKTKKGPSITWTYNKDTKTLTISGKGAMEYSDLCDEDEDWDYGYSFDISMVKKVVINKGITEIGSYCFESFNNLKTVKLPSTVKKIDHSAFSGCQSLDNITIPKSVKVIGRYAFHDCSLSNIKFEKGSKLNKIASYAFEGSEITKINIGSNVSVGKEAFYKCLSLKKVVYNATEIPENAFEGCESLSNFKIGKNVESIGKGAFKDCSSLEEIVFPDNVTSIASHAFENCYNLQSVVWGRGISTINESTFEGCKLGNVVLPGTVKSIEYKGLYNSGITNLTLEEGVCEVSDWAFASNGALENISIPASVNNIENTSFAQCGAVKSFVVNPNNAAYKSENGFLLSKDGTKLYSCPVNGVEEITIPKSVRVLTESSLSNCLYVKKYNVEEGNAVYTSIDGALYDITGTVLVRFPQGINGAVVIGNNTVAISSYAFSYSRANSIVIPDTVRSIGDAAFEYCNYITSITIPGSVETIPNACFWECKSLNYVKLESGVRRIDRMAFGGCESLRKIRIPTSVCSIGKTSFADCSYKLTFYCTKQSVACSYANKYYVKYKLI